MQASRSGTSGREAPGWDAIASLRSPTQGLLPATVSVDRFFFDDVAQEVMQYPALQALFERLHGLPLEQRPQVIAQAQAANNEVRALLTLAHEVAGESVSATRNVPHQDLQGSAQSLETL